MHLNATTRLRVVPPEGEELPADAEYEILCYGMGTGWKAPPGGGVDLAQRIDLILAHDFATYGPGGLHEQEDPVNGWYCPCRRAAGSNEYPCALTQGDILLMVIASEARPGMIEPRDLAEHPQAQPHEVMAPGLFAHGFSHEILPPNKLGLHPLGESPPAELALE